MCLSDSHVHVCVRTYMYSHVYDIRACYALVTTTPAHWAHLHRVRVCKYVCVRTLMHSHTYNIYNMVCMHIYVQRIYNVVQQQQRQHSRRAAFAVCVCVYVCVRSFMYSHTSDIHSISCTHIYIYKYYVSAITTAAL